MTYNFLIYISYSYALPIGSPLEKEILKRGYTVKWFSDLEDGKNSLAHKNNVLQDINAVINYKPDIVLAATDDVPDFITGLKVQLFHGFFAQKRPEGNNKFAHFRIRGFFDLYCTQGPTTTSGFLKQQKKHKHFDVIETGWSKVDPLFTDKPEKTKQDKPVIMIASTFTKRLSLAYNDLVFKQIEVLADSGKYKFKMVLHPKLPEDIKLKWQALNNANFTYYNTTDLIPLFKQSDILFADTTSAIQEFLLQNKPVVTFKHTFDHDYLINITEADQIENTFKYALSYPKEKLEEIKKFIADLHPYYDGKSSSRVINASINQLHRDKSHLKNKPLNPIRKYKIRKRLNNFTLKSYNTPFTILGNNHVHLSEFNTSEVIKITAIIPTKNEIHNIEAVIKSLDFADEIMVIDSYSTDGTFKKAQQLATKVIQREFDFYGAQKNHAIAQAKHEWILLLDADERVTPELKTEIITLLSSKQQLKEAYDIKRINHFMGQRVNYSGWRNDSVIRLFKRDVCKYDNRNVHERLEVNGSIGKMKHKLLHYSYRNFDQYFEKMNHYANLQAKDYDIKTGRLTPYHFIIKPFWGFFKHYIIQSGFRDGFVGLTIGYVQFYVVFMRYVKLWLLRRNRK